MTVQITSQGRELVLKTIEEMKKDLKVLREEKNIAYTLCGDTWHDNPHFNKLEQDEKIMDKRIQEIEIPTFYGEEISHVNSVKYGLQILRHTIRFRLARRR